MVVSHHGRLLFQDVDCVWLFEKRLLKIPKDENLIADDCSDTTQKKELVVKNPKFPWETLCKIRFTENWLWAVVESLAPGNIYRIRIWDVNDINPRAFYQYEAGGPSGFLEQS